MYTPLRSGMLVDMTEHYNICEAIFKKKYCKYTNFRVNLIFANYLKSHVYDLDISRLTHALRTPINGIFAKVNPSRNFLIYNNELLSQLDAIHF